MVFESRKSSPTAREAEDICCEVSWVKSAKAADIWSLLYFNLPALHRTRYICDYRNIATFNEFFSVFTLAVTNVFKLRQFVGQLSNPACYTCRISDRTVYRAVHEEPMHVVHFLCASYCLRLNFRIKSERRRTRIVHKEQGDEFLFGLFSVSV